MKMSKMTEIAHTEEELINAIRKFYPEGTDAEHNLMKYAMILKSQGTSFDEVLDKMKVEGSPFLHFPSRD